MLVLSRRTDESIVAGDVRFTILAVDGGQVKVGIEAPRDVVILREELLPEQEARGGSQELRSLVTATL